MTSDKVQELKLLTERAGGLTKALKLIHSVKGASPSYSALSKSAKGDRNTTDYVMQSYIDDLSKGLKELSNEKE
ncbi:hypothetical protein [Vibrio harveyi]|uniref:hypothetical protein n=1 Tax=Vibrio harveyi TaxID=669 RepID=UPI003D757A08